MHQTPPYPGAAEGAVPSSSMDAPLTEERRAARRVRRRVCSSGSPTSLNHGESDDAQEMSTNSTEISSSDCYTQLSSESSDEGCENRSSGHRRKRRKTSVISSASEQSGNVVYLLAHPCRTLNCYYSPFTCEHFVQGKTVLLHASLLSRMMFR